MTLSRRNLLSGAASLAIYLIGQPANAFLPVILADLAAVTALGIATGKAADALETAIKNGERLITAINKLPDFINAQTEITARRQRLQQELDAQLLTIKGAREAQSINAAAITTLQSFLITHNPQDWARAARDIYNASLALSHMALMFRQNAIWFPVSAQDSLAELPRLYEARVSILQQLSALAASEPPRTEDEIKALHQLVSALDQLRTKSLKLIAALNQYVTSA
jgi:hypothetical protein